MCSSDLVDYNVYEDILGRETFVQAKMKQTQACRDGYANYWGLIGVNRTV